MSRKRRSRKPQESVEVTERAYTSDGQEAGNPNSGTTLLHVVGNWSFYSAVSIVFVIFVALRGMIVNFSGDFSMAIEYVQIKVFNDGALAWFAYIFVGLLILGATFAVPAIFVLLATKLVNENTRFLDKRYKNLYENHKKLPWVHWVIFFILSFLCSSFIFVVINLYLGGGSYKDILAAWLVSLQFVIVSSLAYIFVIYLYVFYRGTNLKKLSLRRISIGMVVFLLGVLVVFPSNSDIINGGSSDNVYCIQEWDHGQDKNPSGKKVNALPIKYDPEGVQFFTGEYENRRWENVHREYIQFEKGYKVTSGVCKPSISSSQPPQYSRSPQ